MNLGGGIDPLAWARELQQEQERVAEVNAERATRRGYLVFATDPTISPEQAGYREVFATEAKTPNQAIAKVRPLAEGLAVPGLPDDRDIPGRAS